MKKQPDADRTGCLAGQSVCVFGSAFDPPTRGHLDAVRQVAAGFDSVLLVPCAAHPFGKVCQDMATRERLLQAFCQDARALSLPCTLVISCMENQLLAEKPDSPVYTWRLLDTLSNRYPESHFSFLRGPDNATPDVWHSFYRYQDIESRWPVVTVEERVPVRSSRIRQLLRSQPVSPAELNNLVTPSVGALLLSESLYRNEAPSGQ